jgi:PPM family protein phosphatase
VPPETYRLIHADDTHVTTRTAAVVTLRNSRESQQDAALVSGWVCAVADGIGGHANGAEAATTALTALGAAIARPVDAGDLDDGVAAAHAAVSALANGDYRNPGTTLVAVAVGADRTCVHGVWVGDSRAYLVAADGTVSPLTVDHADRFGGLTHALGDHGDDIAATPGTFAVPVGVGACVLLCSDGVHGPAEADDWEYSEEVFTRMLPCGLAAMVRELAGRGSDNATAVLVDIDAFAAGVG